MQAAIIRLIIKHVLPIIIDPKFIMDLVMRIAEFIINKLSQRNKEDNK